MNEKSDRSLLYDSVAFYSLISKINLPVVFRNSYTVGKIEVMQQSTDICIEFGYLEYV